MAQKAQVWYIDFTLVCILTADWRHICQYTRKGIVCGSFSLTMGWT
jgi:hypothetical protein